jgi:hypothetical protein
MFPVSFSTSLRLVASIAAAGALTMQPVSTFAQSAPASCAPVLDLANPAPGEMLLPGAYTIQGAALDASAAQGSGIDHVSFFLGDRNAGGMALGAVQPDKGARLDDFSLTVTLPSARLGEQQFVAYAHSSVTGEETQVSFPVVLGEDPSKTPLRQAPPAASSLSGCDATATALATAAAPVLSVPGVALPAAGIAAAEAYAAAVQTQVPDADATPNGSGEDNNQQ